MDKVDLDQIRQIAEERLSTVSEGSGLSQLEMALIQFGLAASVTSLNRGAIGDAIEVALQRGATIPQLQEILSLVSGLGVHSLMVAASQLQSAWMDTNERSPQPLSAQQQQLWEKYVGEDPYWSRFEREVPNFLEPLLRLSPAQFEGFFEYCAIPWKNRSASALIKELIAVACDATPAHRFLPGFRLHLQNALSLGADRKAILQTLDLAANAPVHIGTD